MNAPRPQGESRWLPKSIASRLYLILFSGLLLAHGLSFGLLFYERYESATSMLMSNLEQDVVVAVNLLDHLPAPFGTFADGREMTLGTTTIALRRNARIATRTRDKKIAMRWKPRQI